MSEEQWAKLLDDLAERKMQLQRERNALWADITAVMDEADQTMEDQYVEGVGFKDFAVYNAAHQANRRAGIMRIGLDHMAGYGGEGEG